MTKIFIDPGHGGSDSGAVGNGMREKDLTLTISRQIRDMLLTEYDGVEVRMSRDSDTAVSLSERATMANNWEADYFCSVHINAGGGTGFESYIHSSLPTRTQQLQNIVHPAIVQEINVTDRGRKHANFVVLRETAMPAILTENLFIDNVNDAERLQSPSFLTRIARGHVTGITQAFGLERKTNSLYKVQCGAFSQRANADTLAERLRNDGYSPYIYQADGLFKVQVGAFAQRSNAEALVEELQSKGYEAVITVG